VLPGDPAQLGEQGVRHGGGSRIVAALVEASGGALELTGCDPHGLRVTLTLPGPAAPAD
jgi:hypothetical protein